MLNFIKRFLIIGTVVVAVSAPSVASARFDLYSPAPSAASNQVQSPVVSTAQPTTASSDQSFRWGDAAIGAAAVLVLTSVGFGAVLARRRIHQPATS